MNIISVNKFRDNLKSLVEQVISRHEPLKVTRRAGEAFVIMSAEDWEREQETLHVLQNQDLMQQIAASLDTHSRGQGYIPNNEQMNEITGIWGQYLGGIWKDAREGQEAAQSSLQTAERIAPLWRSISWHRQTRAA
jgi:antitoxin YefM